MPQFYTISMFKVGDYMDKFGNIWCEVLFHEFGEPARWSMKQESTEKYAQGIKVYGHIEEVTSQSGKPYNRFKTDQRPEAPQVPITDFKPPVNSWDNPKKEDAIARAVALRHAVVLVSNTQSIEFGDMAKLSLEVADEFLAWLNKTTIDEDIKNVTIEDLPY